MVQHTWLMNEDYSSLLRTICRVCLLSKGPRDVVESAYLQRAMLYCYLFAGSCSIYFGSQVGLWTAVGQASLDALILTLFSYLLLAYFSLSNRFKQVMTALYASGALISMLSIPLVYRLELLSSKQQAVGLLGWLVFIIICWSFVVMAHILREAIQKHLTTCLLLTFCYIYLSYQLINFVYPQM